MRNRFGRRGGRGRRGGSGDGRPVAIDVAGALERIAAAGVGGARSLEPLEEPGVPPTFAALGVGEGTSGPLLVGFSPHHGGDAALAVVAAGLRLAEEQGFDGSWIAVAPQWGVASRRRLGLLGALPRELRALSDSSLAADDARVEPEAPAEPPVVSMAQAAAALAEPADRELFLRAAAALEGLAAKHGGVLRGVPGGAELVLLARRAARLSTRNRVELESFLPDAASARLAPETLANELDRLEGLLRKRLNDRHIRSSDEGLRTQLIGPLAAAAELRGTRLWPWPGADPELLDLVGVQPDGVPAVGALRRQLGLPGLGSILDALAALRPALPALVGGVGAPLRLSTPRLLLAAREFDPAALRVLPVLAVEARVWEIAAPRGRDPYLERRELGARAAPARLAPPPARAAFPAPAPPSRPEEVRPDEIARHELEPERPTPAPAARPRFEEVSVFDLDEERVPQRNESDPPSRRRRRGRRRRGGRRPEAEGGRAEAEDGEAEPEASATERGEGDVPVEPRADRPEPESSEADDLDDLDLSRTLAALAEDLPDLEEAPEPDYEEEEEEEAEASDAAGDPLAEREARRQARLAKAAPGPEPAAPARPTRRRAAIVAHADRDSVLAALLLARDIRLLDGFWVYPQSELMTFFRSVAIDLREDTPICVIGFTASPARDTIQAASLYAGRLDWFDHHQWPPEDLEALREAVGRDRVVVHPGAGSSVPAVLSVRARRSRFSDKLVELGTGAFSQHDYERWGRVWWQRLADVASRSGERRADLEPLLVGRPSDLAREAAAAPPPPAPAELAYLARRDFRLVHFGGHALVVVLVPPELDLHLCGRIARERYAASLSLCHRADDELVVLGGDESRSRRGLDLARMVQHLAAKHVWIEELPSTDHVARLRVRDLPSRPERLDEVIAEIAMGRSILEG